jgi:hypothetical protein
MYTEEDREEALEAIKELGVSPPSTEEVIDLAKEFVTIMDRRGVDISKLTDAEVLGVFTAESWMNEIKKRP